MAQRTARKHTTSSDPVPSLTGNFADEFRAQARQRRFARSTDGIDERAERLSHDPAGSMAELSRMADRVIEARDVAAAQRARADRAERDLRGVNDRLLAARGLVHEAQRMAHMAAERTAYLEGRCEALERALDMSLNASMLQRWKWRRSRTNVG